MRSITLGLTAIALPLALVTLSGTAAAAGDAAAGKKKIATCMACHGQNGKATTPDYPNLCGQNEKYMVKSLKAYKSGARNDPLMKPMVATLSDEDMQNVAAWYASQSCK